MKRALALAGVAALALAACTRSAPPAGLGRRISTAPAQALRPSADGQYLAWLDGCAPLVQPGLAPGTAACDLRAAPISGGEAVVVARGVSTLPGGFAWSAEGQVLAALEGFAPERGAGALVAWTPGGAPRRLGDGVAFWAFAPRGRALGFVWRGALQLWQPGGEALPLEGATGVATFAFHPAGESGVPLLLARRALASGGDLLALTPGRPMERLGGPAGDYGFSPGGDRIAFTERSGDGYDLHVVPAAAPRKGPALGEGVTTFAFSPDGSAIAFVADQTPGRQGDLWVARGSAPAGRVARAVGELRWARAGGRLAWLEQYDPRARAGALGAAGPGERLAVLGKNVSAFELSPDGGRVAFLEHVLQGGYSVDLKVAATGPGAQASTVARGVFGFDWAADGALWYRTGCVRNAEACDLEVVPPGGGPPQRIAEGVKSFEFDRARPGRVLLGWSRQDRVALDLALWEAGKLVAIDRSALPGSAFLLGPDASRVAYVVNDPRRPGVYVADLPR